MIKHHHFIGRFEVKNPPLGCQRDYLVCLPSGPTGQIELIA